jgi:hypothetical protein
VWIDEGELLIGDSLIERISGAIEEFDFVAALVSESSVKSNWCRKEIALAMTKQLARGSRGVTVLPLRVADVEMPESLRDVRYLRLIQEMSTRARPGSIAMRSDTIAGAIFEAPSRADPFGVDRSTTAS